MNESLKAKTILITGASTGIGRETARYFAQKGWNVAATMRTPQKGADLLAAKNIKLFPLDVLDVASIETAIQATLDQFGAVSEETIRQMPDVLEAYHLAGTIDYQLKVVARDIKEYAQFLQQLAKLSMIRVHSSAIALYAVKQSTVVPTSTKSVV